MPQEKRMTFLSPDVEESIVEGVDILSVPRAWTVNASTVPGKYAVRRSKTGWTCTCVGYQFQAQRQLGHRCKHIKMVQQDVLEKIYSAIRVPTVEVDVEEVPCATV